MSDDDSQNTPRKSLGTHGTHNFNFVPTYSLFLRNSVYIYVLLESML